LRTRHNLSTCAVVAKLAPSRISTSLELFIYAFVTAFIAIAGLGHVLLLQALLVDVWPRRRCDTTNEPSDIPDGAIAG
jgi:hypothetical protein